MACCARRGDPVQMSAQRARGGVGDSSALLSVPSLSIASDDPLFADMLRVVGGTSMGGPPGAEHHGLPRPGSPAYSWGGAGAGAGQREAAGMRAPAMALRRPREDEQLPLGAHGLDDGVTSKRPRGDVPAVPLRCLDITHGGSGPCTLCRPAPEEGTEEQYQLVGDVGKKNGACGTAVSAGRGAPQGRRSRDPASLAPLDVGTSRHGSTHAHGPCTAASSASSVRRREETARVAEQDGGVERRGREGGAGGAVRQPA